MNLPQPFEFIFHIDKYLEIIIQNYGAIVYLFLFLIIFAETGLVFTPILPGDSLVFVTGAFAAQKTLNIFLLFIIFVSAAIIGDTVNYWIGSYLGKKISNSKFIKKEYLEKTENFYTKHGGKTIIIARFIPIIRTFAPFVAGIGKMQYAKFLSFNIIGGVSWISLFLFSGYYFGAIPWVENNLTPIIFIIIGLSIIPPIWEYLKAKYKKSPENPQHLQPQNPAPITSAESINPKKL